MDTNKARELLERGYVISRITDAIKALETLNIPGLYLHEASTRLTVQRVNEITEELRLALSDLHTGTEDEISKLTYTGKKE